MKKRIEEEAPSLGRVIRKREVCARLGVSAVTIWRWEKNSKFIRRVALSDGGAVGYLEAELTAWLAERAAARG